MLHDVEAILLTGGASSRMGVDKAKIEVEGEHLAMRIARLIDERGVPVTICGREPIPGFRFQQDEADFEGPLAAIARFTPTKDRIFIASCDLAGFNADIIEILADRMSDQDAAIPRLDDRLQPLCALYRTDCLTVAVALHNAGERRVMRWLDQIRYVAIDDLNPLWIANVNTPSDLQRLQ